MSVRSRIAAAALAVAGAFAAAPAAQAGATLDGIRSRNIIACGVNVGVAGFSLPDSQGVWRGMDADLCRGPASAGLGDPNRVRFVPLTAVQRFTALQSGEIAVLIRQTTLSSIKRVRSSRVSQPASQRPAPPRPTQVPPGGCAPRTLPAPAIAELSPG